MNQRTTARDQRIQAIVDAARCREALGQGALHRRGRDGEHVVIFRGQIFTGPTLGEAIEAAGGIAP